MSMLERFRSGGYELPRRRWVVIWPTFILANIFGLAETAHFGWNFLPGSDAEMICDGITCVLFVLSFRRLTV